MRRKNGVSLIVLSITILVMAILAATVIISLEDSEIIGQSKNTVKKANYSDEFTRLVVIKNGVLTDNLGKITVDEYINKLIEKDIIENGVITNADGSKSVVTKNGFTVVISQKGLSDLEIKIDGYTQSSSSGNSGSSTATISLNKTTIAETISTGISETVTLVATTNNIDKEVTWTSSNEAVATVSATGNTATITLLDGGVTTITASANGKKATCTITVTAKSLEGQQFTFAHSDVYGLHLVEAKGYVALENGKTYVVVWDGVEYTCVVKDRYYISSDPSKFGNVTMHNAVGNSTIEKYIFGVEVTTTDIDTGEPFLISYSNGTTYITSNDTKETHYVEIYEKVD